jgi:formylglycine-generating enzyme required for sulfatase activity
LVTGGTFYRSYDGVTAGYTSQSYPATVSNFRLDRYEITVGRFRKFVAAYSQSMTAAGAGKNPSDAGDPGWDVSWNNSLPADALALQTVVKCDAAATWTDTQGANENRPMNCIDWYQTFAFCIWDGGRLPTEAEWNYAASAGNEQRIYPWSNPPNNAAIDCSYANYYRNNTECATTHTVAVGSKSPKGDGKWGQADLGGNVWEWTADWLIDPYPQLSCTDCSNRAPGTSRVARGGGFHSGPELVLTAYRGNQGTLSRIGARCARAP